MPTTAQLLIIACVLIGSGAAIAAYFIIKLHNTGS